MARFDRAIALAVRLVEKNGQLVAWKSVLDGASADVTKPWLSSVAADTSTNVYICFIPIRDKETRKLIQYLKGSENSIPTGSLAGLMAGSVAITPSLKDVVVRDGKTLRLTSIDLLSPNGQKILYILEFVE